MKNFNLFKAVEFRDMYFEKVLKLKGEQLEEQKNRFNRNKDLNEELCFSCYHYMSNYTAKFGDYKHYKPISFDFVVEEPIEICGYDSIKLMREFKYEDISAYLNIFNILVDLREITETNAVIVRKICENIVYLKKKEKFTFNDLFNKYNIEDNLKFAYYNECLKFVKNYIDIEDGIVGLPYNAICVRNKVKFNTLYIK